MSKEIFYLATKETQKALKKICEKNDEYSQSKKDIIEYCAPGEKIYQYIGYVSKKDVQPGDFENSYKIVGDEEILGYVLKKDCAKFKKLIEADDFAGIDIEIIGGKYKQLDWDGEEVEIFDNDQYYVNLSVYNTPPAAAPDPAPAPEPKKRGLFGFLRK